MCALQVIRWPIYRVLETDLWPAYRQPSHWLHLLSEHVGRLWGEYSRVEQRFRSLLRRRRRNLNISAIIGPPVDVVWIILLTMYIDELPRYTSFVMFLLHDEKTQELKYNFSFFFSLFFKLIIDSILFSTHWIIHL